MAYDALQGARILVVEDEAIIAFDLELTLGSTGAKVIGPVATLAEAQQTAENTEMDVAILDVRLGLEDVWPLVPILVKRRVPFVFHTGHGGLENLKGTWPSCEVIVKPAASHRLLDALDRLLRHRIGRDPSG